MNRRKDDAMKSLYFNTLLKTDLAPNLRSVRPAAPIPQFAPTLAAFILLLIFSHVFCVLAVAQTPAPSLPPKLPALTGPQKRTLGLIAREAVDAAIERRPSREATVDPRLAVPQALVISLFVDGQLRARAWRLTELQPLYLAARDLTNLALSTPKVSPRPILFDELPKVQISLAVLSEFTPAKNETEIPPGTAVVIYHGFTEWLGLPGDLPSPTTADLLSHICQQAGLRPKAWLLPQTTIYSAQIEGTTESDF